MIKIIICGAAGRMGQEIIRAARLSGEFNIVAGIEAQNNQYVGKTLLDVSITDDLSALIAECDCVIDFTNHQATIENIEKIKVFKKPFVTGTTGFSNEEMERLKELAWELPIFVAPNMSLGINHLYRVVKDTVQHLPDYDIEIIETHHRGKKDAPSGTARAIARVIQSLKPEVKFLYGRQGRVSGRRKDEVCINTVRGGDVVGEHRVLFLGDGEFLELRHYATARRCFAAGTLAAVKFIIDKPAGLYSMADLIAG